MATAQPRRHGPDRGVGQAEHPQAWAVGAATRRPGPGCRRVRPRRPPRRPRRARPARGSVAPGSRRRGRRHPRDPRVLAGDRAAPTPPARRWPRSRAAGSARAGRAPCVGGSSRAAGSSTAAAAARRRAHVAGGEQVADLRRTPPGSPPGPAARRRPGRGPAAGSPAAPPGPPRPSTRNGPARRSDRATPAAPCAVSTTQQRRAEQEQPGAVAEQPRPGHVRAQPGRHPGQRPAEHGRAPAHDPAARRGPAPRAAASGRPPGAGAERGQDDDESGEQPATGAGDGARHDLARSRSRRGRAAASGRRAATPGHRSANTAAPAASVVADAGVQEPGDQPRRVGREQQQHRSRRARRPLRRRPGPAARPRPPARRWRSASRAAPGTTGRPAAGPSSGAGAGRDDQPRQHGVGDQHRPVPDQQPLGHERVPLRQRDRRPAGPAAGGPRTSAQAAPTPAPTSAPSSTSFCSSMPGHHLVEDRDHGVGGHRPRQRRPEAERVAAQREVRHPDHVVGEHEARVPGPGRAAAPRGRTDHRYGSSDERAGRPGSCPHDRLPPRRLLVVAIQPLAAPRLVSPRDGHQARHGRRARAAARQRRHRGRDGRHERGDLRLPDGGRAAPRPRGSTAPSPA